LEVAGPSLVTLIIAIPFYWGLVILIEKGVFSFRRSGGSRDEIVDMHQNANDALLAHNNLGDSDVEEEERRIQNGEKN